MSTSKPAARRSQSDPEKREPAASAESSADTTADGAHTAPEGSAGGSEKGHIVPQKSTGGTRSTSTKPNASGKAGKKRGRVVDSDSEEAASKDGSDEDSDAEHAARGGARGGGAASKGRGGASGRSAASAVARGSRDAETARQLEHIRAEQQRTQRSRLRYLLGQSELFKHFLSNSGKDAGKAGKRDVESLLGASSHGGADASSRSTPAKHRLGHAADEDEEEDGVMPPTTRLSRQPACITGHMRDYQLEGLNWLISLHENGINGILADEMGLGKTLQTISLLGYLNEYEDVAGPFLILVPKSTLSNWLKEVERWCPSLVAIKLHGDQEERSETINEHLRAGVKQADRRWNILVTTYEVANIERSTLVKIPWQYLIIDEAHRIKNESSTLSTVVRSFVSAHRLLITGTPLQNNLHELWALLNFLLPDVFGSSAAFDEWFNLAADTKDEEAKAQTIRQLHRVLRPFMLRRLKADVAKALPPKRETLLYVGMTSLQRDVYKGILMRNMEAVVGERGAADKTRLSNILMHLRKTCNHPYLMDGVEDRTLDPMGEHLIQNCAKLQLLDKLLHRLKERGSRVLIFSQMTSLLDILEDFCIIRGLAYCRIDGSSSYSDREESIDVFNAPGSSKFVFLLSTRAGGLGINLATADVVILYDSDWNPQSDLQAQDRAHRIGQTKPVHVYRLITEGTVEEKVVEAAMIKLKLDAVVVQQGRLADKSKGLSKEDMLSMIQFGADAVVKTGSAEGGITDADIDEILRQGEAKTQQLAENVDKKVGLGGGLLDFKIDTVATQVFEGINYADARARKQAEVHRQRQLKAAFVENMVDEAGAARAARRSVLTYNEEEVFRALQSDSAAANAARSLRNLLPPEHRPSGRMDPWTFIDRSRVMEICAMEIAHIQSVRERALVDESASVEAAPFPSDLIDERAQLIASGFMDWRKADFLTFVKACATHGRNALDAIIAEMAPLGKSAEEVRRYASVFWRRGASAFGSKWPGIVGGIKRGEAQLTEAQRLQTSVAAHLARFVPGYAAHVFVSYAAQATMAPVGLASVVNFSPPPGSNRLPYDSQFYVPPGSTVPPVPELVLREIPNAADPYSDMLVTGVRTSARELWTREADARILACAGLYGVDHPELTRRSIVRSSHLLFDLYSRTRSEDDLDARLKLILRACDRDTLDAHRRGDRLKAVMRATEQATVQRRAAEATARKSALMRSLGLRLQQKEAAALQKRDAEVEAPGAGVRGKHGRSGAANMDADHAAGAARKRARPAVEDEEHAAHRAEFPTLAAAALERAQTENAANRASGISGGVSGYTHLEPAWIGGSVAYARKSEFPSMLLPMLLRFTQTCEARTMDALASDFMKSPDLQSTCTSTDAKRPRVIAVRSVLQVVVVRKPEGWVVADTLKKFVDMTPDAAAEALKTAPIEYVIRNWRRFDGEDADVAFANRRKRELEAEKQAQPAAASGATAAAAPAAHPRMKSTPAGSAQAAKVAVAAKPSAAPAAKPRASAAAQAVITAPPKQFSLAPVAGGAPVFASLVPAGKARDTTSALPLGLTRSDLVRWRMVLGAATSASAPESIVAAFRMLAATTNTELVVSQMNAIAERTPTGWTLRQPFLDMSFV